MLVPVIVLPVMLLPVIVPPEKLPLRFTLVELVVTTAPGSCASASVPEMFAAKTELALPAVPAFTALPALAE